MVDSGPEKIRSGVDSRLFFVGEPSRSVGGASFLVSRIDARPVGDETILFGCRVAAAVDAPPASATLIPCI